MTGSRGSSCSTRPLAASTQALSSLRSAGRSPLSSSSRIAPVTPRATVDGWVAEWRARQGEPPADLIQAAAWITRYLIDTFQVRRHLLRALALHVRSHPKAEDASARERRSLQHRFLIDAMIEHRDQILHADPERAVQAAVFGAASICRERILFSEGAHARTTQQSNAQLLQDVTRMIVGLLRPVDALDHSRRESREKRD